MPAPSEIAQLLPQLCAGLGRRPKTQAYYAALKSRFKVDQGRRRQPSAGGCIGRFAVDPTAVTPTRGRRDWL